jgi:hypothetical protein
MMMCEGMLAACGVLARKLSIDAEQGSGPELGGDNISYLYGRCTISHARYSRHSNQLSANRTKSWRIAH